jgi:DNA mismatch repair protein MSH5
MASIGALLDHLAHERAVNELDDDGIGGLEVRDIEMLSLYVPAAAGCISYRASHSFRDRAMQINADALLLVS